MADNLDTKEPARERTALELFWGKADHLEPAFADNLHLQMVNEQFYLTFGQVRPSVAEGPQERVVAEIHPVARLIVSRGALQRIVELLDRSLKATEQL